MSPRTFSLLVARGHASCASSPKQSLQLTLAIIKPHLVPDPHALQHIRRLVRQEHFYIIRSTVVSLSRTRAEQFYEEHRGRFFFERLVSLMSSGESAVHILAAPDAIQRWRQLMGPTKVFRTQIEHPNTIRARYGVSDTRNAVHGSDSPESARREIEFFFPSFDWQHWSDVFEPLLRLHSHGRNKSSIVWNAQTAQHELRQKTLFSNELQPA